MLLFLSIGFMDNVMALFIIFLCLFCFYLYYENNKLKDIIDDLKEKDKKEYEKEISKEDIVSINDISNDAKEENNRSLDTSIDKKTGYRERLRAIHQELGSEIKFDQEDDNELEKLENKNNDNINKKESIDSNVNKNIERKTAYRERLKEIHKELGSEIKFDQEDKDIDKKNEEFEVYDFVKKNKYINRKLDSSDMNSDYLADISTEIENNIRPQTIQLTDYEQAQEDNAIISYKELVSAHQKEKVIDDGTVEFIEELKRFRNNLKNK
ncbi:MAG: hypothetical protein VZS44_08485 [Bacilli bacterium]|nr:hypothetical protein [Bacilli bacterium]